MNVRRGIAIFVITMMISYFTLCGAATAEDAADAEVQS
jgi:hypothetical protein